MTAVTALLLGADTGAHPVLMLPLPYVQSHIPHKEITYSTGVSRDLGRHYSVNPRAAQIQKVVDDALASFHDQPITLRLTLLDERGEQMGLACTYYETFLRGTALGWYGACLTLDMAGLFEQENGPELDRIQSVRVEVLPLPHRLSGDVMRQRQLLDKERQKRVGRIIIFADGTYAVGRLREQDVLHWFEQYKMARADPDFRIFTPHQVTNHLEDLKGRIISMPGASIYDLAKARDTLDRGGTVVWYTPLQFS